MGQMIRFLPIILVGLGYGVPINSVEYGLENLCGIYVPIEITTLDLLQPDESILHQPQCLPVTQDEKLITESWTDWWFPMKKENLEEGMLTLEYQ